MPITNLRHDGRTLRTFDVYTYKMTENPQGSIELRLSQRLGLQLDHS